MKTVMLFGLGHLGEYLIKHFKDYKVIATKTEVTQTNQAHLDVYSYKVGEPLLDVWPKNPEAVIWTIPPREQYLQSLKSAEEYFNKSVPWFFISSTSVYSQGHVDESNLLDGTSSNAKLLIELENFLSNLDRTITIIRPGGLVDEFRHPSRFLSQKNTVDNGLAPVNLVHTEDVARFIIYLLENKKFMGTSYNLVNDLHSTKKEYYGHFLKTYYNCSPEFKNECENPKLVSNKKSKSIGFSYQDISFEQLKLFISE